VTFGGSAPAGEKGSLESPDGPHELRSDTLRVVVDPVRGAKITSLLDVRSGREWLLAADQGPWPPAPGSTFVDNPICGWDEMFPNAYPGVYTEPPYAGVALLDHGEVWSRPWRVERRTSTSILSRIEGQHLPYTLEREVVLDGSTLRLSDRVIVREPHTLSMLWAAHPQLTTRPGTRVSLRNQTRALRSIEDGEGTISGVLVDPDAAIDLMTVVPEGAGLMLHPTADDHIDGIELKDLDGGWLRMTWDATELPNFGLWVDHGLYAPSPVICPEPATAFEGDPHEGFRAVEPAAMSHLDSASWTIHVSVGSE
jgi:hypothetical protein